MNNIKISVKDENVSRIEEKTVDSVKKFSNIVGEHLQCIDMRIIMNSKI